MAATRTNHGGNRRWPIVSTGALAISVRNGQVAVEAPLSTSIRVICTNAQVTTRSTGPSAPARPRNAQKNRGTRDDGGLRMTNLKLLAIGH